MEVFFAGAGAAIATALVSYLIARRNNSGTIDTSDAATLWAESQAMRKELRDEVVSLRTELAAVKKELIKANRENQISHSKIAKQISIIRSLEKRIKELGGKI